MTGAFGVQAAGSSSSSHPNRCAHPVDRAPCEEVIHFAPDPDHLDHTPIKYVKVVLHILQNRDANDYHPDDLAFFPGNFTNSVEHMQALRDWFHHPVHGMNASLANLCEQNNKVPGFETPYISDARIRFIYNGIENQDVFFYDDKNLWDRGFHGGGVYPGPKKSLCIHNNQIVQSDEDILNAVHVIIAGANRISPSGNYDNRYNTWAGVYGTGPFNGGGIGSRDDVIYMGSNFYYYMWNKHGLEPSDSDLWSTIHPEPSNVRAIKSYISLRNEWLHIVHVDHPDPIAHMVEGGVESDYCDDVPGRSNNMMDYKGYGKCALTQCQIGRIHQTIDNCEPSWIRTEENAYSYPPIHEHCAVSQPDIIIPSGQVVSWNRQLEVRSNIIVEPGAILNISCEVGLPSDARIIVKKSGVLNLNAARLYCTCPNSYWDGVIVEGDGVSPQIVSTVTEPSQGYVSLKNGSIIENARVGVQCFGDNGLGGGIVKAENSTFINCQKRCVDIRDYQRIAADGTHLNNLSRFDHCSFIITPGYPIAERYAEEFTEMIRLEDVEGVTLYDCDLICDAPATVTDMNDRGRGISALDAGFFVRGACVSLQLPCTEYDRNTIKGFDRGIYVVNTSGIRTFTTTYTDFDNNFIGIEAVAVPSPYLRYNEFVVGSEDGTSLSSSYNNNQGVRLINCSGYDLSDNEFKASNLSGTVDPIGTLVQSSGASPNVVNKNDFEGLYIATLSNGQNRDLNLNPNFQTGLVFECNDYAKSTLYDMAIPSEPNAINAGIRGYQGSSSRAAGNIFSAVSATADPELHIHNRENHITYWTTPLLAPTHFAFGYVQLNGNVVSQVNHCQRDHGKKKHTNLGTLTPEGIGEATIDGQSSDPNTAIPAQDELIRHLLINDAGLDFAAAQFILSTRSELYSRFREVDALIQRGQYSLATSALDEIPIDLGLSGEALNHEYASFKELKLIQVAALSSSDPKTLLESHYGQLAALADGDGLYAHAQAKGMLWKMHNVHSYSGYTLPLEGTETSKQSGSNGIITPTLQVVYTTGQDVVSYRLPAQMVEGELRMYDMAGRRVWSTRLLEASGQVELPKDIRGQQLYQLVMLSSENLQDIVLSTNYLKY